MAVRYTQQKNVTRKATFNVFHSMLSDNSYGAVAVRWRCLVMNYVFCWRN